MVIENRIFVGKVRHRRYSPKRHEFNYKIFMFCFDISKIQQVFEASRWFSMERLNWFTFKRAKHVGPPTQPLDLAVREHIKEKTGKSPQGKIFLVTHLSTLGYCFNPISLYMVFKPDSDEIEMLLTEVTNTPWGEQHIYILDTPQAVKKNTYQYAFKKILHVSPFMQMEHEYRLNFKVDNSQLILHMDSHKDNELHFDATLSLSALALNSNNIKIMMRRFPFMTYKVTASIYWEALKLLFKRVPFYAYPKK
jgi:DUF1365 family protein